MVKHHKTDKKKIIIVGSGVVGQATGKGLIKKGHKVVFIDKNPNIVKTLNDQGFESYSSSELPGGLQAEIYMFCISTPCEVSGNVDLSSLSSAVITCAKHFLSRRRHCSYPLFVIRSTVPPNTTRRILLPLIEMHSGMKVTKDFGLCMQPEFLRAASSEQDFLNPRITVIGEFDDRSGNILQDLYEDFGSLVFKVDLETAEFMKYVHNCFNATKISFSNEMWLVGQKLGIDANLALRLAVQSAEGFWNPTYGTVGGQPYGLACLPKDVKGFLKFTLEEVGFNMQLLSAVNSVNSHMTAINSDMTNAEEQFTYVIPIQTVK